MTEAAASPAGGRALLDRIGLRRRDARAWAVYDLGSTPVGDVVVTAVFPVFFASVLATDAPPNVATTRFALATAGALALVAIAAPWLGHLADAAASRKRLLATFAFLGAAAVMSLGAVPRGAWLVGVVLFAVANIGLNGAAVFRDALLPHVVAPEDADGASTASYALGYLGSAFVLTAVSIAIERPDWLGWPSAASLTETERWLPVRASFVAVAVWWIAFSVPLLRQVREPAARPRSGGRWSTSEQVRDALVAIRQHPRALRFLLAYFLYAAGAATVSRMAVVYGAELGLETTAMIMTVIAVDLVGIPCALAFAAVATRLGTRRTIHLGIVVYCVAVAAASRITSSAHFFAVALLVACVQGGTFALSRSLLARLVPSEQSAQFFGLYSFTTHAAGALGPAAFAVIAAATGSSRLAVLAIAAFFLAGAAALTRVDGRRTRKGDARCSTC